VCRGERGVSITLTDEQIRAVLDAPSCGGLAGTLSGVSDLQRLRGVVEPLLEDKKYSTVTLRSALVLAAFPPDGSERTVTEIASEVGYSPSVVHRYLGSWVAVGVLMQDPHSRRYRRTRHDPHAVQGGDHAG
jgi:hypothetical protein